MLRRRFVGAVAFFAGASLLPGSAAIADQQDAGLPECPSNFSEVGSCAFKFTENFYDVYVSASILYLDSDLQNSGKIDRSEWEAFVFNKFTSPTGGDVFSFTAGSVGLLARIADFYNGYKGEARD
ncbi:hypothetical protein [Segnochrobactrum spirostomi]|uniref:Uncharacterized protein n=1 Tax=Segnochrobactrum spirostomi TaxID=2608987 RepID=A0A6A7Y027_9HYPH|nr:hypothetical protein [Segnochrobactrum spirostomi]MQT11737.1 hypothetical protein [Segnochrobactrum spirostomi]